MRCSSRFLTVVAALAKGGGRRGVCAAGAGCVRTNEGDHAHIVTHESTSCNSNSCDLWDVRRNVV